MPILSGRCCCYPGYRIGLATWPKLQGYGPVTVIFLTDRGVSERTGTARYVTRSVVRSPVH